MAKQFYEVTITQKKKHVFAIEALNEENAKALIEEAYTNNAFDIDNSNIIHLLGWRSFTCNTTCDRRIIVHIHLRARFHPNRVFPKTHLALFRT